METPYQTGSVEHHKMLPPEPGTFHDREELIQYVREFGAAQGYVVTIRKSKKDKRVILGCDRGGVYRNRRKIEEMKRKRNASSRLINCPFEAIGKKEDDEWVLTIKNAEHNHEPLRDMSEHPYSRRFSEEEIRQIKIMTEAGIKPRQVLKALKKNNPELQSTPRHLYNLKAKIRQGNLTEKNFKTWRPTSFLTNRSTTFGQGSSNQHLKVSNFIGGKFVDSQGSTIINVVNPATQQVVSYFPLSTYEEFKDAVIAAKKAFPSWRNTPMVTRQRIMFKLQELICRDMDKLATNITAEQGKTLKGARGDVLCGLEVVEHICGLTKLQMGEFVPNASNGIDTYCIREPLGVCAGICPFNFPAIIPLWMFPIAIMCGNTFVLKPCEKNPGVSMILAALAVEAGLPNGVLNIIHGTDDITNYMCDDVDIKAFSFVSSDMAGMHINARAAARGKRVQSNVGGKNYAIIMPDASMDDTLDALISAGFGAAGQRSMALSTAVFVGGSMAWETELVKHAKALKVSAGTDPAADLGPVISKEVKDQISIVVQNAVDSGARLLLDGRNIVVPGYENGSFIGPTILCDVTVNMDCDKEEVFGPVLLCMQADNLEEAISIVNKNRYRNGATLFTTSGVAARKFQSDIDTLLVGVNVPVPVPMPELNFGGKAGVEFYTNIKTVAQQWRNLPSLGASISMVTSLEMETTGVSSALPSSERDSPGERSSPASERDSPMCGDLLRGDLCNLGAPSVPPTFDKDLPSEEASPVLPSRSQQALPEKSQIKPLASERELPSPSLSILHPSTSMHVTQTSQWNENFSLSSQSPENGSANLQRIHVQATQVNSATGASARRVDVGMALTPGNENMHSSIYPLSHGKDSIASTSQRIDATMCPAPERSYNTEMIYPTSEKTSMPLAAHWSDQVGSTSQMPNIGSHPSSNSTCVNGALRASDMILGQGSDIRPPTSETVYIPQIIPRSDSMQPTTERIYMPPTSERIYSGNPVSPMVGFPSQGTLASSTSQKTSN